MKQIYCKSLLIVMALFVWTGCKTNKEAFNAAYERAKAKQDVAVENPEGVVVSDSEQVVREASEAITVADNQSVSGKYGVVVGSFVNRTNADMQLMLMKEKGYKQAVLGVNANGMHRVIVAFYATKSEAYATVNKLKAEIPDVWILIKE